MLRKETYWLIRISFSLITAEFTGTRRPFKALSQNDLLLCSETLVSDMRHMSKFRIPEYRQSVFLCLCRLPGARRWAAHVRYGCMGHKAPPWFTGRDNSSQICIHMRLHDAKPFFYAPLTISVERSW